MKSLKVIVFSLAFFLFLSVNTSAQISIDGNFTDWADVPALATDAAGDGNGSCDFTALYVTDDANYVYIRVSLAPGSDVSAAGKTINLFVSVDPDNEPAAISGLSYGWWSNGYDFFSQIYPDNWDFFKHVGANTWWSWAATGTPGIMAWNAGHNDVEVRLPKAELNNPDIAGFSSQGKIAVYVQASDYSDEITSSGAHGGFIYTFKPVQTNGVINITMIPEGYYSTEKGVLSAPDTLRAYLASAIAPDFVAVDSSDLIIDSVTFTGSATFTHASTGAYYLYVAGRAVVQTWSANEITYTSGAAGSYDFTTAASQAYGSNMVKKGTKWCLYSGDVDQSKFVDNNDLLRIDNDAFNFVHQYTVTDLDGTKYVDNNDLLICDNNAFNFVGSKNPRTGTRSKNIVLPTDTK